MYAITDYTLDTASTTITLGTAVPLERIVSIIDLTSNDTIYDINLRTGTLSITGTTITYTCDNNMSDGDILRIIALSEDDAITSISTNTDTITDTINTDLNAQSVIEQAPLDQQLLNETALNAVTTAQSSTSIYTGDKQGITMCVVAAGTPAGTVKLQGSPDGTNTSDLGLIDEAGNVATSYSITAAGTYFYSVVNAATLPYVIANLSSVTDGTFTIYVFGRAI
jgi:hypothetical protein